MNLKEYIGALSPEELAAARAEGYVAAKESLPRPPTLVQVKPPEVVASETAPGRSSSALWWEKWSRGK